MTYLLWKYLRNKPANMQGEFFFAGWVTLALDALIILLFIKYKYVLYVLM